MPRDMDRKKLLREITALDFKIIELNLFLNTHPDNRKAIEEFNQTVTDARALKEIYNKHYGMLTSQDSRSRYPWEWLNEPWPWEFEANYRLDREVK
jgi:spore coat protein JB